jgi:hypothetical protein
VINCRCTFIAETEEFLDRDDAWMRRVHYLSDNEKVVKIASWDFLTEMQRRIEMRLEEQVKRRRTA